MKKKAENTTVFEYLKNEFQGHFLVDEPLSRHTWYRIGGPADFFVYPRDEDSLIDLCSLCGELGVDRYVMGKGANLLVSDGGFKGVVINLEKFFNRLNRKCEFLEVGAGVTVEELILYCERNRLGGVEGLSGIPSTVGGALIMNAGAGGSEIKDVVTEVRVLDENFQIRTLQREEIRFGYRSAPEFQGMVVLGSTMKLHPEKEEMLREKRLTQIRNRAVKQPLDFPSCGSVFKRPKGGYAGHLIQEAGLKGFQHGNAMISDKHAGFIVNLGGATAEEVLYLIGRIQETVKNLFSVELELEVRLVGLCA